ncbi:cupredoxin domain-containing protein [Patescibacteria group bacterium]|nr:cupredoxin domain-containing protein [Patescibacteria group bacterium]
MKNILIAVVVVALLALGGWYYMNMQDAKSGAENAMGDTPAMMEDTNAPKDTGSGQSAGMTTESTIKEFTVDGTNFKFSPELLSVKKGDTVRIKFVNSQGFHDFVIDEFKVATPQIKEGEAVVEFVADKVGSFEYYCSVGSHRAMGMKGTLSVTE